MAQLELRVLLGGTSPMPDTPANARLCINYSSNNIETQPTGNLWVTPGFSLAARSGMRQPAFPYQAGGLVATTTGNRCDSSQLVTASIADQMAYHINIGLLQVIDVDASAILTPAQVRAFVP